MSFNSEARPDYLKYLKGDGEMAKLTRSFDWSSTVLNSPETWSPNLLTTVNIILNSRFPMFLWWGKELIQFYNDAYRPSFGNDGKHPKALGQRAEECWPELWQTIHPLISQVMAGGEAVWNEDQLIPMYRNNKLEDVYWTFSYSQVMDGNGEIGGVLVTCNETTAKVVTQQETDQTLFKLAESHYSLLNLIKNAPVAIGVLKTRQLIIETANEKILQLWGKPASVIGTPLSEALPELEGQPFLDILDKVYTTGKGYSNREVSVMLEHGGLLKKYYFDLLYQPIPNLLGKPDSILIIATDLTEQVQARHQIEESSFQFRQLADSIIQMVWVTDAYGNHEYYNQRWYDFTGSDFETTKGEGWNQMFHPDDRESAWAAWRHSLETGEPYEIEYRLRKQTGEYIWVLGRAAPYYDGTGNIIKWFGTCTDIHEQKFIQDQKDEFISIASHELKTPITTLKASLQILGKMMNSSIPKNIGTVVEKANKSMDKVGILIEDLLNASRFNHGQLHLRKTLVKLSQIITECEMQINYGQSHAVTLSGILDLQVSADPDRIGQVVTNFINNAIKYAPNSRLIEIKISATEQAAKVTVTDHGEGIAADKIPHIFDRYYRVDSSGSQYSGLGLGLYICAEIIKKHEGTIGVDSSSGRGSDFWFTLPLH